MPKYVIFRLETLLKSLNLPSGKRKSASASVSESFKLWLIIEKLLSKKQNKNKTKQKTENNWLHY